MAEPARRGRSAGALAFAAVLLATALLYWPALSGPLLLDDYPVIAPLMQMDLDVAEWPAWLSTDTGPLGRPLAQLTFLLNAHVSGDELRGWKAVNLAVHLAIGSLLYATFRALALAAGMPAGRARRLAFAASAVWLVHPLLVSTVMYTVQRMTQLATLFSVLGMLLYVRGRAAGPGRGRAQVLAAFFLCTPLAALAKETGLLLPYLLGAVELTVFARAARPRWLGPLYWCCAGVPLAAALAWLALEPSGYLLRAYAIREFTPGERVLTEARILVEYLSWIIAPSNRAFGFFHDDVRLSRSLAEPATLGALLALAALASAAWRWRGRAPLAALGVAVYFIGHVLESGIFGLELAFEHRNYLPAAGIVLAIASLVESTLPPRMAAVTAFAVLGLFGSVTAARCVTWGDEGRLYHGFVAANPGSPRARLVLAEWYAARGEFDSALAVEAGVSGAVPALHRLRVACARDGRPGAGASATLASAAAAPVLEEVALKTLVWLATAAERGQCALPAAALAATLDTVLTRPARLTSRYRLAVAAARLHYALGARAEARARLLRAASLQPRDPFPWYLAAEWSLDAGAADEARQLLEEARARDRGGRFRAIDAGLRERLPR